MKIFAKKTTFLKKLVLMLKPSKLYSILLILMQQSLIFWLV